MNPERFHGCKAILFDFGGTLDSDGEHWLDRFYALYEDLGLLVPLSEIKKAFYHADALCSSDGGVASLGLRPLMTRHVRLQFAALGLVNNQKEQKMVESFCIQSERFLQRNARLLRRLKNRYRLGLVSNFYGNVGTLCEEAGMAGALDVILDSALVGMRKPDPAIFRSALRKLNLPPHEAVCVGDSFERDVIPAREVGMKTIWLKGPHPRIPENAADPDEMILSLSELEVLVS